MLVIHGGAGGMSRDELTPELRREFAADLEAALRAGHAILARGGSALDAVEASVRAMEDSPRFNAGKGAALTRTGRVELDASIMDGSGRKAGAVAGVTRIRNPITAARAVMEKSSCVLLIGPFADQFAEESGLELVDQDYFKTEHRIKEREKKQQKARGTVGAVARDRRGRLAAATSTGGTTAKRDGRVGDSPIIGAGTFADDRICAVSCTGEGEVFLRWSAAHDVAALVEYKGLSIEEAARVVVHDKLKPEGGEGGLIAVDRSGRSTWSFNCEVMHRGSIGEDGAPHVASLAD